MASKLANLLGITDESSDIIIKQGWLFKRSKHLKQWHKRFIQLKGDKLESFKNEFRSANEKPTETFDLSDHHVDIPPNPSKKNELHFYLISNKLNTFRVLRALSVLDRLEWVFQIRNVIMNTNNNASSLFATVESQMASRQKHEMYDSESDEEEPASKRKQAQQIDQDSFNNYKVRRFTLHFASDSIYSDDDNEDIDEKVVEENDANVEDDDTFAYDKEIMDQLITFGYKKSEILQAMEQVIDAKNINEIREKLDQSKAQEVIESKQDKMQRKRRYIEQEIITTEETYYNGLNILLNELIEPIFKNGFVDKKYYEQITSSLPQILEFHRTFYSELKAVYLSDDNQQTIAHVFNSKIMQNKEKFIEIYIEFIKDYEKILALFGSTFHGNYKLDAFLLAKRTEMKPLTQFLILPVQRVPRYILLLKDLLKNTDKTSSDYKEINDAVRMTKEITQGINERKRQIENLSTALQIQESLQGLKEPIMNGERTFEEQFIFIKKEIKHQRLFFVFNDIVIIANEKWDVKHILKVDTLAIKVKGNADEQEDEDENTKKKAKKGFVKAVQNYKFGDLTRSTRKKMVDAHMTRRGLPEFELMSKGDKRYGKAVYVAKNIGSVNSFTLLLQKFHQHIND